MKPRLDHLAWNKKEIAALKVALKGVSTDRERLQIIGRLAVEKVTKAVVGQLVDGVVEDVIASMNLKTPKKPNRRRARSSHA